MWGQCDVCRTEPAVWGIPWHDELCERCAAEYREQGGGDVVFRGELPVCRACGESYTPSMDTTGCRSTHDCVERLADVGLWQLRCPECGQGPGDAPSGHPEGPIAWFDDAVEFPWVWSDPDSVVCCSCCGTFFILSADGLILQGTEQV